MILKMSKTLLVGAVAFFYTLVIFNNLTDYGSNYAFVHHVLLMDSTFPGNHGMWRAIHPLWIHALFYDSIICWEAVTMLLLWFGSLRLFYAATKPGVGFRQAKSMAVAGLTISLLMWFVAFLSVGGEWFLMWQSHDWNGQDAAFRMFLVVGMVLLYLVMPEGN